MLVDRHVIHVPGINGRMANASRLEPSFFDCLYQYLPEAAVARRADVLDPRHQPDGFEMAAAHRVDEDGVSVPRNQHIARHPVPLEVSGEPEHPPARAPVTWSATDDEGVESEGVHLVVHRLVAASILAVREALVYRIMMPLSVYKVRKACLVVERSAGVSKLEIGIFPPSQPLLRGRP